MVRADRGELTKLPGIATFSSLVSLGVVHDQQRAPYDVGWQSSGWSHPRHRCGAPTGHLTRICRRTCQPCEVVACRAPREAGLATAPVFLHHPGQAGGACLRHRVDQAPYCSSWMVQKYRAGLEAAFWWRRNWWLSLSSSGLTLSECDAVPAATLPLCARRRGELARG